MFFGKPIRWQLRLPSAYTYGADSETVMKPQWQRKGIERNVNVPRIGVSRRVSLRHAASERSFAGHIGEPVSAPRSKPPSM
jgi:hypothetical protein